MPSSPDDPGSCSCCPYPGDFSHTCQEAGSPLKIGAHDSGNTPYARATTSPENTLQRLEYQLSDPRSRQYTSPGPATVAGTWDSATIDTPGTADEAAPGQDDWTKIQAISQGASALYSGPSERPHKRPRDEFEAGGPPKQCPGPASHSTCFQALEAELARVIWRHIGSSHVELRCTGARHSLQLKFAC